MKYIFPTIICLLLASAAWSQQWRLQKIHFGDASGMNGQKRFTYSGDRTSDYKNGIINFDYCYYEDINANPWEYSVYEHQKYDHSERQIYYIKSTAPGTDYRREERESIGTGYTSTGKISSSSYFIYRYKLFANPTWTNYYYDSLDRLILKVDSSSNDPRLSYITKLKRYYYDSIGNLASTYAIAYSTFDTSFNTYIKASYQYDANNNLVYEADSFYLDSVTLTPHTKKVYTYDNNKLVTTESYQRDLASSILMPTEKQVMVYENGPKRTAQSVYIYDASNKWAFPTRTSVYQYEYNADNDILKLTQKIDSTKNIETVTRYSYNFIKQPDTITVTTNDKLTSISVFFYEIYWPAKIIETTKSFNTVSIFPNPSSDIITIQAELPDNKEFTVSIIDMQGRLHKQWNEAAKDKNYLRTVPVPDLPPGNYILQMKGNDFKSAIRFSILR